MDDILASGADARPLFSKRAIAIVFVLAIVMAVGFGIAAGTDRSELLDHIDPDLQAGAIGAGVFVGLVFDAMIVSAWRQGIAFASRSTGGSIRLAILLVVLPGICALAGTYTARRIVEYRAFHGLPVETVRMDFTVTGVNSGKSGQSLSLIGAPGERTVRLGIDRATWRAAQTGDDVLLPVQTGRGGVRRMVPPPQGISPGDLHH